MSGETFVTIIGRLTKDPDLKFLGSSAVAEFSVAVNARKFNKQTNEWEPKPTKFWDCVAWNAGKQTLADNVVEVLQKGASVVVHGELETREWKDSDGKRRSADQIRVISVGKDLTWHQGNSPHQASGNTQQAAPAQQGQWGGQQAAPAQDPWSAPSGGNAGGWGNGPADNAPPF